jgi:hypothetical protein
MQPLPDGTYEALVLDVGEAEGGGVRYELTLLRGEEKGRVVAVSSPEGDPDDLSPMGIGATLVVREGRPSVVLDTP